MPDADRPVKTVPFYKYHGLGNDFVVMRQADAPDADRWVRALCDRHRGVGADGLLWLVEPDDAARAASRMVIYNRDGSRPEMCGNGVRCVVRHLVEVEGCDPDDVTIMSDAGPRRCQVTERGSGAWQVTVEMGAAAIAEAPVQLDEAFDDSFTAVDMGNPHAVTFCRPDVTTVDAVGERLNAGHQAFPQGVNVEFVEQTGPQQLRVDVYERGVGRTMACGTGACAAAAAAIAAGKCSAQAPVEVELPGGTLRIEVRDATIWMTGPVEHVFDGELTEDWLDEHAGPSPQP